MSTFQEKLKALYVRQDKIAPLIEGLEYEIPPQSFKDGYTKPKMIIKVDNGKELQDCEPITDLEALFDPLTSEGNAADKHPISKLLIEGGPGVGKTTSMQYFAYKWSQGELWKDKFDYVYRVPLKVLLNRDWDYNSGRQDQEDEDDILKFLVHYNLSPHGRKICELQDIPWKKEKTLLLLDGYDEVAHVRKYKKVCEEIFDHKNIILASRPYAIDKKMAEKFGRKIENTGFDHNGINQYLMRYFKNDKDKGLAIEEYLEKNPFIKEICYIPTILAILCLIWCEGGSNQALRKVSNLSDLYHQMMNQIGFRYYAKQQSNLGKSQGELADQWNGGTIYLDELRVLQHIAFERMTNRNTWQESKPQVFPGTDDDEDEISIQSSINYLSKTLKKQMPTINQVLKFGLLKSEDESLKESSIGETNLTRLNFSFIHFSFQEYLTARYLAEMMNENNQQEQTNLANLIAQHRNEPRYLTTFKFLAGILSTSRGEKAEQNIKIFWDAIMCNTDGVLELGVETKISLLMHLLSQTRKREKIDRRIPHLNKAINLIDGVVLGDLSRWKTQLKESDYTSDNIQDGLIEYFVDGRVRWLYEKSLELKKQINRYVEDDHRQTGHIPSPDDVIDVVGKMIRKFSEKEVDEIFPKGLELLKKCDETEWRQTKKAIGLMTMIHRKSDLEDKNKKELLYSLLKTVHDDNLNEISSKAIKELIHKHQNQPLAQILLKVIKESFVDITTEAQYQTMWTLAKLAEVCGLCDVQLTQEILNVLIQLLKGSNQDLGKIASKDLTKFVGALSKDETHLVRYTVDLLLPILSDPKCPWEIKISTSKTIKKVMEFSDKTDIQLFKNVLEAFRSLLEESNGNLTILFLRSADRTILLSKRIRKLIMMTSNAHNNQLVQDAFEIFNKLLQDSDAFIQMATSKNIVELLKKKGSSGDDKLSRNVLEKLLLLLENPDPYIYTEASTNLNALLKVETKLIGNAINSLIPLLEVSEGDIRNKALESINKLCNNNGAQFTRNVLDKLLTYWKTTELNGKKRELRIVIELLKITGNNDKELIGGLIPILHSFLTDPDPENKISGINCLTEVVKGDMELVSDALKTFKVMLKDDDPNVRKMASKNIIRIVRENKERDPQLLDFTIKDLLEFSENSEWNIKTSVAEIIGGLKNEKSETGLVQKVLDTLIPLLQNENPEVRVAASNSMINFLKASSQSHSGLIQKILTSLTPLLESSDSNVRMAASDNLRELMDISGNHFLRDLIKILTSLAKDIENYGGQGTTQYVQNIYKSNINGLFKMKNNNSFEVLQGILRTLGEPFNKFNNKDPNLRRLVSKKIIELITFCDLSNDQLFQEVVNIFEPLLSASDWESIDLASNSLIQVLKRRKKQEPRFVQRMINILTQFLENSSDQAVKLSASQYAIQIMEIYGNSCENSQLCSEIFEVLKAHLKVYNRGLSIPASQNLIKLAMIKSDDVTIFGTRDVMKVLLQAPCACDFDQDTRVMISNNIIALLKMKSKNDAKLLSDIIDELRLKLKLLNISLVELSSSILKGAFLIMLEQPDNLQQYVIHHSSKLRDVLTSSLRSCLQTYVQNFQSLDELFQDPKSSLTVEKMNNLFEQVHLTERMRQQIQIDLTYLQKYGFSDDVLSKFKSLLASELDQIGSLKGPEIIKLALIITSKENESKESSGHQELIELAKEVLKIQAKYIDDFELAWIYNHYDQLLALSPETRFFYRKVCDKMLDDNVITRLEGDLMTKFINQGVTISLTRDGEVISEETRCKLEGQDTVEKIAKTIIKQQQDILALQYKDHQPIFAKSFTQGMKEAAADKKEENSIVDSTFPLKNDSWLLTILNPNKLASEIVLLEHRSAFGYHFLYHLSYQKPMEWYPGEIPHLEDIFGRYVRGASYQSEIKELADEDGQKLFESKDKNKIYLVQGELISNKVYFQQDLLQKGSHEDRDAFTQKRLDTKLDNNPKVLENYLESLNLSDLQNSKIWEYYEGLVSTFALIYNSSLAIAAGEIQIDVSIDYFSLVNLFKQLCSFAPFNIGGIVFDTVDAIRSYLKTTPIRNKAKVVQDIAIEPVEASDLICKTAMNIISKPENRQRIFDAKEDQPVLSWFQRVKSLTLRLFEKLKYQAMRYEGLKDMFEIEIKRTPAFQLGKNDANKIVEKWIQLKEENASLRLNSEEKREIFSKAAILDENQQK